MSQVQERIYKSRPNRVGGRKPNIVWVCQRSKCLGRYVSKQKNGFFDEDLYNIFFEKLNERFKQWKKNGAVPMRAFEICIDCIYVLSKTAQKLSEKDLEKSKTVKDEMYGLLIGFE